MTLQQLIYFKETAKELHFTRAADNLYVAQSSLSHAIQDLENELGAPLFYRRGGRKIELTSYGKAFLPCVDRVLGEVERAKETITQMIAPNQGVVKIAYSFTNGALLVPELMNAIHSEPGSNVHIFPVINYNGKGAIEDMIVNGEAELAISSWPFQGSKHVEAVPFVELEQFALVPKDHMLAKKSAITPLEMESENIVLFTGAYGIFDYVVDLFENRGIKVNWINGYTDWYALVMQVACGNGITILPKMDIETERVAYIKLDECVNTRTLYLVYPKDRPLSSAATYTKQYILDYFKDIDVY